MSDMLSDVIIFFSFILSLGPWKLKALIRKLHVSALHMIQVLSVATSTD